MSEPQKKQSRARKQCPCCRIFQLKDSFCEGYRWQMLCGVCSQKRPCGRCGWPRLIVGGTNMCSGCIGDVEYAREEHHCIAIGCDKSVVKDGYCLTCDPPVVCKGCLIPFDGECYKDDSGYCEECITAVKCKKCKQMREGRYVTKKKVCVDCVAADHTKKKRKVVKCLDLTMDDDNPTYVN